MKVIPLGVNGAFTKYYHNNYVFELGERKLLVDAGTTLRYSLKEAGYEETDITDVIITHLHSDHVGGLEEFAQRCKWIHNHKPNLWVRGRMMDELEEVVGKGLYTDGLTLDNYFNVYTVECGSRNQFKIDDYTIELIKTDDLHAKNMKSFGLCIELPNRKNVLFTSDIAKHEVAAFKDYINNNTVALFHDISLVRNPVHSYIDDVAKYYEDAIDLKKIYAMHYQDDVDVEALEKQYGINFVMPRRMYEL
jgi:glyoxylase-like metal-dependent hydrolase (beta-lactamase superfamily II)